ncbi:MAG: Fe-S cluster assembly protein SufD [Flavihumibacter sp.]
MIITTSLYDQLSALYAEKETAAAEPWFSRLRTAAFDSFRANGFPTAKNEEWRFTNVSPFLKEAYQLQPAADAPAEGGSRIDLSALDAYEVVLNNGVPRELPEIPGIRISALRDAAGSSLLQQYLGRSIQLSQSSFAALNTALFTDGLLIEVEKNATIGKPLLITHAYNAAWPFFAQPRLLVVAHRSSRIELVERYVVEGQEAVFANGVTECFVAENARVDHYDIQVAPANFHLVNFTQVSQQADSLYNNHTYTLPGASFVRNNLHLDLQASNTESHLYGLYLAGGSQLVDNHTLVNHAKPHCFSNELYKGVLADTARAVFNGKIMVQLDAQKTNAFQQNNNMLLSDKAVVDSKPQLEIFADDVKCSHGSTLGSFDESSLFYLKARGIGEASARNMLVKAFAFDVTQQIPITAVRDCVEALITQKMESLYDRT